MQNLEDLIVIHTAPEYAAKGMEEQIGQQAHQRNPHNRDQNAEKQQNFPLGLVLTIDHVLILIGQRAKQPTIRYGDPCQPRIFKSPAFGDGVQSQRGQYVSRNGHQHGHSE